MILHLSSKGEQQTWQRWFRLCNVNCHIHYGIQLPCPQLPPTGRSTIHLGRDAISRASADGKYSSLVLFDYARYHAAI